jgi:hypothetical protein
MSRSLSHTLDVPRARWALQTVYQYWDEVNHDLETNVRTFSQVAVVLHDEVVITVTGKTR